MPNQNRLTAVVAFSRCKRSTFWAHGAQGLCAAGHVVTHQRAPSAVLITVHLALGTAATGAIYCTAFRGASSVVGATGYAPQHRGYRPRGAVLPPLLALRALCPR